MGILYLIQPEELIGTDRYKIGMSNNNDLVRCKNGYGKNSRYIIIGECPNPLEIENKVKIEFKNKFKLIKGQEYFEGDLELMKKIFISIVFFKEEKQIVIKNETKEETKETIKNNKIIITKYDDLIKNTKFKKIIITEQKIYLLIEFKIKQIFEGKYKLDSLKRYLEHNLYSNLYEIDINSLVEDISSKCYLDKNYIEVPYYCKTINLFNETNFEKEIILDFKNKKLLEQNTYICFECPLLIQNYNVTEYNMFIKILNKYVDKSHLERFKELCKSIFVERKKIIFYDYNSGYTLSHWLFYFLSALDNVKFIDLNESLGDIFRYLKGDVLLTIFHNYNSKNENKVNNIIQNYNTNLCIIKDVSCTENKFYNIESLCDVIDEEKNIKFIQSNINKNTMISNKSNTYNSVIEKIFQGDNSFKSSFFWWVYNNV